MACLIACEAETCYYNYDGQCDKVGGFMINSKGECDSYVPNPPIDFGLNSNEKRSNL